MSLAGYGTTSFDSSDSTYLTGRRGLYVQLANISNPDDVPSEAIIDTTVKRGGEKNLRARQQTLVLFAICGVDAELAADAVLYLWIEDLWAGVASDLGSSSSHAESSSAPYDLDLVNTDSIPSSRRWALIKAEKHANNSHAGSLAFVFIDLPAGRYKAAISSGVVSGPVVIAEQHTE